MEKVENKKLETIIQKDMKWQGLAEDSNVLSSSN